MTTTGRKRNPRNPSTCRNKPPRRCAAGPLSDGPRPNKKIKNSESRSFFNRLYLEMPDTILPSLDQYPRVFVDTREPQHTSAHKEQQDKTSPFAVNPLSSRGQAIFHKQAAPVRPDHRPHKDPLVAKFGETDRVFA